jgi:hypothetical protein
MEMTAGASVYLMRNGYRRWLCGIMGLDYFSR